MEGNSLLPSHRRSLSHPYNGDDMRPRARRERVEGRASTSMPPSVPYDDYRGNTLQHQLNEKRPRANKDGESGRRGIHPWKFLKITFRSSNRASALCNLLWPFVPAALAVRYTLPDMHVLIFSLAYVAMIPCANLVGFAGQELSRKLPHVAGILVELTCGSVVEIVLFMTLMQEDYFYVIKAAILGSILNTMLLCLGLCFFAGGLNRHEQSFSDAISEVGSGLLFMAGVALSVPTLYSQGLRSDGHDLEPEELKHNILDISRIVAILLIVAHVAFVFFQTQSHHGIYDAVFEYDEKRDADGHEDRNKAKLTLIESIFALTIAIGLVTIIAIILVLQIHYVVEVSGISDPFMGLILVPLVEKFAEHLTSIDEAYDNQMNFALSHILGATLQTALFNAPLTVIVAWGLDKNLDLNFEIFDVAMLILGILVVGKFLQDMKSNYLEGLLLVLLYIAIGAAAYQYPNPKSLKE